jgi:release factor glutamine methyltransferase
MTPDPLFRTLAAARARLVAAGVFPREAAVDVDLFARAALGWDRARLITEQNAATPDTLEPAFSTFLSRRARREPSAYIIGSREFWGLDFHVTPEVLIPRPETEFVVEEAIALLRADGTAARDAGHRIADIGTGCGCIAVSLAHELPDARITATDVSAGALAVAELNAARHGVAPRIDFARTSYLDGIGGPFDLIGSNPPYVKAGDKPALSVEVRHEPDVALFGGSSGFVHIDAVLDAAIRTLRPSGWLVMEFGFAQDEEVEQRIAARRDLQLLRIRADLQGILRTAIVQRSSPVRS